MQKFPFMKASNTWRVGIAILMYAFLLDGTPVVMFARYRDRDTEGVSLNRLNGATLKKGDKEK